ncbi:MAG: efflux RND transporter periplasmic adaptor subunit [Deltaproteobacteria bacterium]|nr:efflux RND transporter periplasmic adaptor subunit [Deltaproteobacteria bacterium]
MNPIFNRVLRKGWKWIFLAALIGVVTYKTTFAPVPVSTQSVTVGKIVAEVMGTGTLEAHYLATVSAKIQGLIVELLADQNDWIKTGQLLARLDDSDLIREVTTQEAVLKAGEASVERAKADEAKSQAILDQAKVDYQRYAGLVSSKSVSQEIMDKYAQNLAVAQADLGRASAAVSEADRQFVAARERLHFQQARLADTRIYAPFDGLITRRDRDVGDIVIPGASIFKLVSVKEMWVSAWVDETSMAGLAKGQPARVVFRSEPKKNYEGKVSRLGTEVDRETREFLVDVGVETLPENWAVGQRAEVYIETGKKNDVVQIPLRAIVWKKGKSSVFLERNGRAKFQEVSLGLRGIENVEVTSGIAKGAIIITGPDLSRLTDGLRVYNE